MSGRVLGEMIVGEAGWTSRLFNLALHVSSWSKDQHRSVGAVLVAKDDRRKLVVGYNGFPHGIHDLKQRLQGEERLRLMVHAEANALDNAWFSPEGGTVYVTKAPCLPCVLRLANARVARVVCPRPDGDKAHELEEAMAYAHEAGITVTLVEVDP